VILFEVLPKTFDKELRDDRTQSIDLPAWMAEQLSQASPDLLRAMLQTFAEALMSADADAVCGAGYGQRSPDRTNTRNGYRQRGWDTRAGSIDLAVPKLREGSYFPDWLLERRRRAESALVSVVATSYLLGVSTRRMEKLVEQLGITRLSKSQVSEMAKDLDGQVEAFRTRPLDGGPYTFVAADALVLKVRSSFATAASRGKTYVPRFAGPIACDFETALMSRLLSSPMPCAGWLRTLTAWTRSVTAAPRLDLPDRSCHELVKPRTAGSRHPIRPTANGWCYTTSSSSRVKSGCSMRTRSTSSGGPNREPY
jgi:hypothetical protein